MSIEGYNGEENYYPSQPTRQATGEQQRDGLVAVHADGGYCHGVALIDGRCLSCGTVPDMQSTELWEAPLTVSDRPPQPRGPARLDAHGLAELRAIVLRVIDDGWRCADSCDLRHPWKFNSADDDLSPNDEAYDNENRLRFCDAIQQAIIAATTPAVKGMTVPAYATGTSTVNRGENIQPEQVRPLSDHDFRPMPQNPQWCTFYGCMRDKDGHVTNGWKR